MLLRLTLILLFFVFSASISQSEGNLQSGIPSISLLEKAPKERFSLSLPDHNQEIRVDVYTAEIEKNTQEGGEFAYVYRPVFYLDLEKFNSIYDEQCSQRNPKDLPGYFRLNFRFPDLSGLIADQLTSRLGSNKEVISRQVFEIPYLGYEIKMTEKFGGKSLVSDIDQNARPQLTDPFPPIEIIETCETLQNWKVRLNDGMQLFEANLIIWSTDTAAQSISIQFQNEKLEEIENTIFGVADYTTVFIEDAGGSERREKSSTSSQSSQSSRTGGTASVGLNVPLSSFNLGFEGSRTGGSSSQQSLQSNSDLDNYEKIINRLQQGVEGKRIVNRDYLTRLGLASRNSLTVQSSNMPSDKVDEKVDACLSKIEDQLDYYQFRLKIYDENKAVLTTSEFAEQIGMLNLKTDEITRLKSAGALDLNVVVLDKIDLRNATSCKYDLTDDIAQRTGAWALTYNPVSVAKAWKEKQKSAQIDASVEELAGAKFSKLQKRIDDIEASMNSLNEQPPLEMVVNGTKITDISQLSGVFDEIFSEIEDIGRLNDEKFSTLEEKLSLIEEALDNTGGTYEPIEYDPDGRIACIQRLRSQAMNIPSNFDLNKSCTLRVYDTSNQFMNCDFAQIRGGAILVKMSGTIREFNEYCKHAGIIYLSDGNKRYRLD